MQVALSRSLSVLLIHKVQLEPTHVPGASKEVGQATFCCWMCVQVCVLELGWGSPSRAA